MPMKKAWAQPSTHTCARMRARSLGRCWSLLQTAKSNIFAKKFMSKTQVNFLCLSGASVYTVNYRFSHFNPPSQSKKWKKIRSRDNPTVCRNDSSFAARYLCKIISQWRWLLCFAVNHLRDSNVLSTDFDIKIRNAHKISANLLFIQTWCLAFFSAQNHSIWRRFSAKRKKFFSHFCLRRHDAHNRLENQRERHE